MTGASEQPDPRVAILDLVWNVQGLELDIELLGLRDGRVTTRRPLLSSEV